MGRGITLSLQCIASSASQVLAAFVASAPPRCCDRERLRRPDRTVRPSSRPGPGPADGVAGRYGGGPDEPHETDETLHSEVGRADGTHVLNRRFVPLVIGALGAALGVVAVVTSTIEVGLVAGITALLAGAAALTLEDPTSTDRRVAEAQTAERLGEAELNTARGELSEARQRIEALDEEVRRLSESTATPGTPRAGPRARARIAPHSRTRRPSCSPRRTSTSRSTRGSRPPGDTCARSPSP